MSVDERAEIERLAAVAADSWYATGANAASIRYRAGLLGQYFHGNRCLELGPAEGLLTEALAAHFRDLTLVEGSREFCGSLRARYPGARVVESLFETFQPAEKFDTIVMGHILEHVDDPRGLMARARGWLADGGVMLATVPNAWSIHRQAAVLMGLLQDVHELNASDRHHGHRRVYDPTTLRADVEGAGLRIRELGGYWIKPLSIAQIDATWTAEMLAAFMKLGERYPDIAAEIYVVATA